MFFFNLLCSRKFQIVITKFRLNSNTGYSLIHIEFYFFTISVSCTVRYRFVVVEHNFRRMVLLDLKFTYFLPASFKNSLNLRIHFFLNWSDNPTLKCAIELIKRLSGMSLCWSFSPFLQQKRIWFDFTHTSREEIGKLIASSNKQNKRFFSSICCVIVCQNTERSMREEKN